MEDLAEKRGAVGWGRAKHPVSEFRSPRDSLPVPEFLRFHFLLFGPAANFRRTLGSIIDSQGLERAHSDTHTPGQPGAALC